MIVHEWVTPRIVDCRTYFEAVGSGRHVPLSSPYRTRKHIHPSPRSPLCIRCQRKCTAKHLCLWSTARASLFERCRDVLSYSYKSILMCFRFFVFTLLWQCKVLLRSIYRYYDRVYIVPEFHRLTVWRVCLTNASEVPRRRWYVLQCTSYCIVLAHFSSPQKIVKTARGLIDNSSNYELLQVHMVKSPKMSRRWDRPTTATIKNQQQKTKTQKDKKICYLYASKVGNKVNEVKRTEYILYKTQSMARRRQLIRKATSQNQSSKQRQTLRWGRYWPLGARCTCPRA